MKIGKFKVAKGLIICLALLSLLGCAEAVGYIPQLIQAGAGAVSGLENVDVKSAVSSGITTDDLHKIKSVAVVLGTGTQTQAIPFGGQDITNVMADNIALELMTLGYKVIERASLDKVLSEQKLQMSGLLDPGTAASVGKLAGVDAVILGNVTSSQTTKASSGFMGYGANVSHTSVISNATMKVVGVEKAEVLMIVTLSYKNGQQPTEASKTMAIALSDKLKNPLEGKK